MNYRFASVRRAVLVVLTVFVFVFGLVGRMMGRRVLRWAGVSVLALLVLGCAQSSEETVEEHGLSFIASETSLSDAETALGEVGSSNSDTESSEFVSGQDDNLGPGPDGPSVPVDDTGGTAPTTVPGDDNPGPGPDGPSVPVDDTGGGDGTGGGPGVAPGVGDRSGGLRLVAPPPPYEGLADEIFDMCDDADAFAVIFARSLGPDEEMTVEEFDAIALDRTIDEVSCVEPGGRRYVYMSDGGPGGVFATVEGATDDHNDRNRYSDESLIIRPPDIPLGYFGHLDWTFQLEDIDEIRVMPDSVLVRDGVVRGLVRNFSKTLFGREVTVTASSVEGKESANNNAVPVSGRFPLTVQPGERAPFEIEGWTGSTDPADFVLVVTADLSTNVDITRSFAFGSGGSVTTRSVDEEFFKDFVPDFVYQAEKHKIDEDGWLMIEYVQVTLSEPTSHPSLADQVLNQTIEDLRVYMALGGTGGVFDVVEPLLYRGLSEPVHPRDYPQVVSQPTMINGFPKYGFHVTFIPGYTWHLWAGEPGPLDYNPRTLPDPGAPVPGPEQEEPPQPS